MSKMDEIIGGAIALLIFSFGLVALGYIAYDSLLDLKKKEMAIYGVQCK